MRKLLLFLGLIGSLFLTNLSAQNKKFLNPERIHYDGSCMTIDGKDMFIYSAAFHYFRCPEELWRDRFRDIKAAGFNTVETYVPWNWHERTMPANPDDNSHFDFADLRRWLKMAQEEFGLYTIVRPGPFICAEFSGGGYPRWLARFRPVNYNGFWLRSADEQHIRWCKHWFDAVCKELADEQLTRKPKGSKGIILIQIENEYNHHGCDGKENLLKALYRSVRDNGWDVPVFTCLTNECRNSKDAELSQVFDCDNYYVGLSSAPDCAYRMVNLKKAQPDAPGFVTELQGGWFSLVTGRLSEENYSDARHFKAVGLMSLLGGATGINYYMFFGGTHLAGWGARGMTTSYDYNAAIRIASAQKMEDNFAKADWNQLPRLVSLSDLGINDFRYNLYRTKVTLDARQATREHFLLFNMFTRDIVSALVNGKQAKRLFPDHADAQSWTTRDCFQQIRPDEYDNRFDVSGLLHEGENEIIVVYENLGHAHGYFPMEELAGIREAGLSLTESALTHPLEWECATDMAGITLGWNLPACQTQGWQTVSLDTASRIPAKGNGIQPKSEPNGLFTWYRIEFELPSKQAGVWIPWLARIQASGNGFMWLNGHNIGRHWEAGPQREFFLPECWLKFGKGQKNVLVMGLRQTANGADLKAIEIATYSNMAEIRK